jgi:hypothetical protein
MTILFNIRYLLNPILEHYETNLVHPLLDEGLPTTVPRGLANNSTKSMARDVVAGEFLADKQTNNLPS